MTTIVVYRGWMAADSRLTDDGGLCTDHTPKILVRDDCVVASAGGGAEGWQMMNSPHLLREWGDSGPVLPAEWTKGKHYLKSVELMLYRWGDDVMYTSTKTQACDPLPIDKEAIAIGSGAAYARMACCVLSRETAYPPRSVIKKSIEYAAMIDVNTGGAVQTVRLR